MSDFDSLFQSSLAVSDWKERLPSLKAFNAPTSAVRMSSDGAGASGGGVSGGTDPPPRPMPPLPAQPPLPPPPPPPPGASHTVRPTPIIPAAVREAVMHECLGALGQRPRLLRPRGEQAPRRAPFPQGSRQGGPGPVVERGQSAPGRAGGRGGAVPRAKLRSSP